MTPPQYDDHRRCQKGFNICLSYAVVLQSLQKQLFLTATRAILRLNLRTYDREYCWKVYRTWRAIFPQLPDIDYIYIRTYSFVNTSMFNMITKYNDGYRPRQKFLLDNQNQLFLKDHTKQNPKRVPTNPTSKSAVSGVRPGMKNWTPSMTNGCISITPR